MHKITNKETGEVTEYTDEEFIAERNRLMALWEETKEELDFAKEEEMKLRKQVVAFAFNQDKVKGTENIVLENGFKAKAVKKINYGFVKDDEERVDKNAIENALSRIEKRDDIAGELIAQRLIKWTPSLSQTEYKLLDEENKAIIDSVLVTTSGAPTLAIIPPKSK